MKTPKTLLFFVIVLVMINNVEHLAVVHYDLARKFFASDWMNIAHSVIVVIIFEVVVITFVMEGKKGFSLFFTGCIWLLSMIYYESYQLILQGKGIEFTAAVIYSTIFSISIYMFSEMLAQWYQEERTIDQFRSKLNETKATLQQAESERTNLDHALDESRMQNKELTTKNEQLKTQNAELSSYLAKYQKAEEAKKKALTCPYCKTYIAESESQLRSHKGHCSHNPKNR